MSPFLQRTRKKITTKYSNVTHFENAIKITEITKIAAHLSFPALNI